jgi:prolyl oligopeptidase
VLREFDLTKREFVSDGFNLPESKSSTVWLDRDTLLLASPLGSGMATRSGYARTIRLWRRGTDPLSAPVIFETKEVQRNVLFFEKPGLIESNIWIGDRTGPRTKLDVPSDASIWVHGDDWLVAKLRTAWTIAGEPFKPDSVIGIPFATFLVGGRHFVKLFEPAERRALQTLFWAVDRLILGILDLRPMFEVLTPNERAWACEALTGLPETGSASVWPFDTEEYESNGDLLAIAHDPLTPPSLFFIEPKAPPVLLRCAPEDFDATRLVMTRHEAVSSDGTRIPYVQVGPGMRAAMRQSISMAMAASEYR